MIEYKHKVLRTVLSVFLVISLLIFLTLFSLSKTLNEDKINSVIEEELGGFIDAGIDDVFSRIDRNQLSKDYQDAIDECEIRERIIFGANFQLDCSDVRNSTLEEYEELIKGVMEEAAIGNIKEYTNELNTYKTYGDTVLYIFGIISLILIFLIVYLSGGVPLINLGIVGFIAGLPFLFVLFGTPALIKYGNEIIEQKISESVANGAQELSIIINLITRIVTDVSSHLFASFLAVFILGFIFLTIRLILIRIQKNKAVKKVNSKI